MASEVFRIQACWKGWYVRQKMKELSNDFQRLAKEIEECDVVKWDPPHGFNSLGKSHSPSTGSDIEKELEVKKNHGKASSATNVSLSNNESITVSGMNSTKMTHDRLSENDQRADIANDTSLWDAREVQNCVSKSYTGKAHAEVIEERNQAVLELYWVQQAIESRKQYLNFKNEYS